MITDKAALLLTVAATVVGSGLGTTIVGALFKRQFDVQLETHKALLQRSSRIHERQVDALLSINSNLEEALFYLQRAASASRLAGEALEEELLRRAGAKLASASDVFSQNKLLMGLGLARKLDEFFGRMISGGLNLKLALDPMVQDGGQRANFWNNAREIAYKELPGILQAIAADSRALIHG